MMETCAGLSILGVQWFAVPETMRYVDWCWRHFVVQVWPEKLLAAVEGIQLRS